MPEARLYSAPSHVPASTSPAETALISNGNHLTSPSEVHQSNTAKYIRRAQKFGPTMGIVDSKPSDSKLNSLFNSYKDDKEDAILAEGIERLCDDLQVSPEEFKVLVFAWKLNAEQMCRFSRSEFVTGMKSMGVDSVRGVQTCLPELVQEVKENQESFKDLYKFTFKFGLDSPSRSLSTDMAVSLWKLVFTVREPPILSRWLEYLEKNPDVVKSIPRDTWNMFLNFSEAVGDDLSSYDDNEAWPCLFDEFVEYERDQMNQNISKEHGARFNKQDFF